MSEVWKAVVGYEGEYEVSDQGWVKSLRREQQRFRKSGRWFTYVIPERLLSPSWEGGGTGLRVHLGRYTVRKVHHLVLEAFVGPRPDGCEGLHADDDPANNAASNLSWGTHKQNMADAAERGRTLKGERSPHARLTEIEVLQIYALCSSRTDTEIAPLFGVARETVKNIRRRERWQHILPDQREIDRRAA